ncbi:MAG: esterase-like activity of phytase family protein [Synechococcaceae cyanobacterium]
MALAFLPLDPFVQASNGVLPLADLDANAEISAYNPESGFLYTVGGGSGAIVVTDLRNPAMPQAVAVARPQGNLQTLQSVAVYGTLMAVAVQNDNKTDPGFVQFYDLSNPALPRFLSTVTVGALPDAVKFNADGTKLLVTNEGEPDSLYTVDPEGSISVINTSGWLAATPSEPGQQDVQTIGFAAWENRRAELINRGIRIGSRLGITTTVAQDIEPEAIAISADGQTAWISLQENNAIAVVDLSGVTPLISTIYSAGIKDWSRGIPSAENFDVQLEYARGDENLPSEVLAGGLSGLFFAGRESVGGQDLDIYFTVTDRGPNGDLINGQRQFLDPSFQPTIYKLGKNRDTGAIVELGRIGLNRADGTPLTGLPQLAGIDDIPIDASNQPLPYDPFGIDSETVSLFTLNIGGSDRQVFAVGDEYRGQIAIFDAASGNLIQRYIPAGQKALLEAQYPGQIGAETIDSLPSVYGNRWSNRGIEGMAFNSNDGLLYAFMQSPLDVVSDSGVRSRSRSELTRILAIDPASGTPVKEHFYLLSGRPGQDKIGDVTFDPDKGVFYVLERDSARNSRLAAKHVYEVDLRGATNTLAITTAADQATDGWLARIGVAQPENLDNRRELIDHDSNPATPDIFSTSSADVLAAAGIRLANKVELFNLPSIGGSLSYDKPEGLTLRDDGALVINYDNDFGTEGASGNTITVVSFDRIGLDSSDRDVDGSSGGGNRYLPIAGLPVYGLTMPDGLAAFTDSLGRQFLLAAGEGDSREYQPDQGDIFFDLTRANSSDLVTGTPFRDHPGVAALNAAFADTTGISLTRLNLLNDYGDITGDGLIDQPYAIGSRSLRIYDDRGNLVFDSGDKLEELADRLGLMAGNRDDDKGTEPEMVEVVTVAGRSYAFVALERTTTSVAAIFDITDPYNVAELDPLVFPGAARIEGITFLRSPAGEPAGVIASSEGNDVVSITTAAPLAEGTFRLQLFHIADQEAGASAIQDAPRLSAVLNALRTEDIDLDGIPGFVNTLTLSSGDAFIPGLFYDASEAVFGSGGIGDIQIQNELGVQAIAFGNHEFDFGTATLAGLIDGSATGDFTALVGSTLEGLDFTGADFPYLSTNLDVSTDVNLAPLAVAGAGIPQPNSITSSVVIQVNGEDIGIVGATTPTLDIISSPGGVSINPGDFDPTPTPSQLDALAAEIQAEVDALLAAKPGMNKVVLLAHMQQLDIERALAARLVNVDIIVGGGSNTRLFDDNDRVRAGDSDQGSYPEFITNAGGTTTVLVNTDGSYKYVGRLVIDFDADGNILPASYDPNVSGAYATDAQAVAHLNAEGLIDPEIQAIVDAIETQILATEGNVFGISQVFLNGNRSGTDTPDDPDGVRTQETNLGNLTADANLAIARNTDPDVVVSIKNGGGIRASIGQVLVPPGGSEALRLPNEAVFDSDGNLVKPEGGISQNDIQTSLAFNNGLTLLTLTKAELVAVLEHGVGAVPGVSGRFPQVSGVRFSYDADRPAGDRILSAAIVDETTGTMIAELVRNGELAGDPGQTFRIVTLNFLAGGGDGYPFPTGSAANRVDLYDLDADGSDDGSLSGLATFAFDGTEQDALAEYLATFFPADSDPNTPIYGEADQGRNVDRRIQNLAFRTVPGTVSPLVLSADTAELLYVAYLGRPADVSGLMFWEDKIAQSGFSYGPRAGDGLSDQERPLYDSIVAGFAQSSESQQIYAGKTAAESVDIVYNFSFGRKAEIDPITGINYWVDKLENNEITLPQLAIEVALGAAGEDLIYLTNKFESATLFYDAIETPQEILGYSGAQDAFSARQWLGLLGNAVPTPGQVDAVLAQIVSTM